MKTAIVCTMCCATAVSLVFGLALSSSQATSESVLAQDSASPTETLMRQKLDRAQRLLEALSLADFTRITSNAEDLQRISLEARWTMPHSPKYAEYGQDFRSALERLVRASENNSIDGAALNYVQVILTCVQCHKVVREGQELARLDGSQLEELFERQMAPVSEMAGALDL